MITSTDSLTFIEDLFKNVHDCNNTGKYFVVADQEKIAITEKAKNFAKYINAYGIVYWSEYQSINIKKIFQILVGFVWLHNANYYLWNKQWIMAK